MRTRARVALIAVGVLAIGAIAAPMVIARVSPDATTRYLTEAVQRTTVTRTVASTGRVVDTRTYAVVPGAEPTLTERNGAKVASAAAARGYTTTELRIGVGSRVEKGDVLAVVEDAADEETKVRAPFDGVVRELFTAEGATAGQIVSLGVDGRRVRLEVSEYDVAQVTPGQSARVELNSAGRTFTAAVSSIASVASASSGVQTYDTMLKSSAWPKGVRVGMTVTGTVTVERRTDVLGVPTTAVTKADGGHTVSVLDAAGQPQTRVVQIGIAGDRLTEVTRGLKQGERVVTGTDGTVSAEDRGGFVPPPPGGATR